MINIKEKLLSNKFVMAATTTAITLGTTVVAHATEPATIDISGPLTTAMNTTVTNTIACFSAIIPIGLTIFGAKFAWVKGIQFFSRIASK